MEPRPFAMPSADVAPGNTIVLARCPSDGAATAGVGATTSAVKITKGIATRRIHRVMEHVGKVRFIVKSVLPRLVRQRRRRPATIGWRRSPSSHRYPWTAGLTTKKVVAVFDGAERAIHAAQEIGRAAYGIPPDGPTGSPDRPGAGRGTKINSVVRAVTSAARRYTLRRGSQTRLSRARSTPHGRPESSWRARRSAFTDRGLRELKGLSERRRVYLVEPSA